jgi:hypothetical protein
MKRRWFFVSLLTVAAVAGAGWYAYAALAAHNTASNAAPQTSVQTVHGETVVEVGPDAQRASHIDVSPLAVTTVEPTRTAYATVVDPQPLFDLAGRLASARAEVDTFVAQAGNSRAQYARSRTLFDDDRNISRKSLDDADAATQAADARLRAAHAQLNALDATLRAQFGAALAAAAITPESDLLRRLQTGRAAVLRVTLPTGEREEAPPTITVDAPDGQPVVAQRLSASPAVDPAVQGEPWLYVSARALPAGMRTSAHVPTTQTPVASLVIPSRAVLWYSGATWVYVKIAPARFVRRFVRAGSASLDDARGIVVTDGFHAGDEVVTQGAQLLLSEELKPQGITTACKDPPECDD